MAARLRKHHQDEVRTKIQASQLINVLQNHALGKDEKELTPSRLKAIEILLKKSVPDLSQIQAEHTGEMELNVNIVRFTDAGDHPSE
ncbi:hypothetical protein [Achromobacter aloeverae]|uniref:Uncharacterized protein n=1 Tax=Achromobacter aloeverae TaxID=1750518 RepID=A0A4Q1HIV2_9BURK|nr:hypothetical protein [Achromobacter aloeverae]RXN88007.1 hypothetical protein C7R54_15640 [Achromobacter aloeverae]